MTDGVLPTGQTRLLAIVGHPVDQVLAPTMWTRMFLDNGIDAACLAFHVLSPDLERFVLGLRAVRNLDGLIVTVPHKAAALSLVDHVTDRARRVGAVNSIRRDDDRGGWVGDSAVEVNVSDVDSTRAGELARRMTGAGTRSRSVVPEARGYDLAVNASPAGMRSTDPLPIDLHGVTSDVVVADVVTKPVRTRLLHLAAERGCLVQDGQQMIDAQIPLQARFFGYADGDQTCHGAAGLRI